MDSTVFRCITTPYLYVAQYRFINSLLSLSAERRTCREDSWTQTATFQLSWPLMSAWCEAHEPAYQRALEQCVSAIIFHTGWTVFQTRAQARLRLGITWTSKWEHVSLCLPVSCRCPADCGQHWPCGVLPPARRCAACTQCCAPPGGAPVCAGLPNPPASSCRSPPALQAG